MKKMFQLLLVSLFSMLLGFVYKFHYPQLKRWALAQIYILSYEELPVLIEAQDIQLSLLPLGLEVLQVKITPKDELANSLAPVEMARVGGYLDVFELILGNLYISEIYLEDINLIYDHKEPLEVTKVPKQSPEQKLIQSLQDIYNVPIDLFKIKNLNFTGRFANLGQAVQIKSLDFEVKNTKSSLLIELKSPLLKVKKRGKDSSLTYFAAQSRMVIEESGIQVSELNLKRDDSYFLFSGYIDANIEKGEFLKSNFKARINADFPSIREWAVAYDNKIKIPELLGHINAAIELSTSKDRQPIVNASLDIKDLKIDAYEVGNLKSKISYKDKVISSDRIEVSRKKNIVHLLNTKMELKNKYKISTIADIKSFELNQLLRDIDVGDVPLILEANGKFPCSGHFKPDFILDCKGNLESPTLWVHNGEKDKNTIVAADNIALNGGVKITANAVFPYGDITIGSSKGKASGAVWFDRGFRFEYEASSFDFADLKNLANLNYEGNAKFTGTVYGNSDYAIIDIDLKAEDFWFENYMLGNNSMKFNYKSSVLSFNSVVGDLGSTKYNGNVQLFLDSETIEGEFDFGFISLNNINRAFSRNFPLPVSTLGTGAAKIEFNGPLSLSRLNFKLLGRFSNLQIGKESFDKLDVHIVAKNGLMNTEKLSATKGVGTADLEGTAQWGGAINAKLTGQGFRLEDSETLHALSSSVKGQLNSSILFTGPLEDPDINLKMAFTNSSIGYEPVKDTFVDLEVSKEKVAGNAKVFGNSIQADFSIPNNPEAPYYLKIQAKDWDFSPILAILSPQSAREGYQSQTSFKMDVSAETGGWWNSSGFMQIDKGYINRGPLRIDLIKPVSIDFQNGAMNYQDMQLEGDGTFLKSFASNSTKDALNVNINGKVNMAMLSFLTPFFEDFRGELSLSSQISGTKDRPELLGSAFIKNGFIRLFDFPHPFENIKTDLLFSQNRIIANSIEASLAGGSLRSSGTIAVDGFKKVPIAFEGTIEGAKLRILDGMEFTTQGNFNVKGDWFPYLLSGNVQVIRGLITQFGNEEKSEEALPSALLPELLLDEEFEVFKFDIAANLGTQIRVDTAILDSFISGNIQLGGGINNPSILGTVLTQPGGSILFRDTPFEIQTGNIQFTNPSQINPSLFIDSDALVKDYEVNLIVQGTAESPQFNLSSEPSLPENDIITLLVLGITTDELDEQSDDQENLQAVELGSYILSNIPVNREIEKRTGFKFRVGSTIDEDTNESVLKGEVSRKWSKDFTTSASRTFSEAAKSKIEAEYKLKRRLSIIGSYETQNIEEGATDKEAESDILGLDLQYKLEF